MKGKNTFIIAALGLLSAIACLKEDNESKDGVRGSSFKVYLDITDTKTVNEGLRTSWVEGDAINLFHIEGTLNDDAFKWTNNGKFTMTNVAINEFTGELGDVLVEGSSYYWHALYPYNAAFTDPSGVDEPYDDQLITIGHPNGGYATQKGNDSMAHLVGQYCPLYGTSSTSGSATPMFTMHQMAAVVAVEVTNGSSAPLKVSRVKFESSAENLVGTFAIDFGWVGSGFGSTYLFRRPWDSSKQATLKVEENDPIPVGETATFYIPMIAVELPSNSTIKLTVNEFVKELQLTAPLHLYSGKLRPVTVTVTENSVAYFQDGTADFLNEVIEDKLYGDATPASLEGFLPSQYPGLVFSQDENDRYYIKEINANNLSPFLSRLPSNMHLDGLESVYVNFSDVASSSMKGTEFPSSWRCPKLYRLLLAGTGITGVIPDSFAAIPSLHNVFIMDADIYGALPHNWASKVMESVCIGFRGENDCPDLGYMVPASLDIVLNSDSSRMNLNGDKNEYKIGGKRANWKGFEKGWGQVRYEKFDSAAVAGEKSVWSVYRPLTSGIDAECAVGGIRNPRNTDNAHYIDSWASFYQNITGIPTLLLDWDQAAADAYTAQCKSARGL